MPTRNVNLTDELDSFVLSRVENGRYENASEVVRAALRMLEREEREYEAKLAALRAAIDEGDASGIAEGDDLLDIGWYTMESWGAEQVNRYLGEIEACCQRLAENSLTGRSCNEIRRG